MAFWKSFRVVAFILSIAYVLLSFHLINKANRYVFREASPNGGLLTPPNPRQQQSNVEFRDADLCVVIGIFSRASENKLRGWQRKHFAAFYETRDRRRTIHIQLRFPIAYNTEDKSLNGLVYDEQSQHGDLLFLPMAESYEWLTAATFEFLKITVKLFDRGKPQCRHGQYIVKADSDVILSYERLIDILYKVPHKSVYMGQMQPDTPMHERWMRKAGGYSLSYLPIWAVGQMYAMSVDVGRDLVRDDVIRTVLKPNENYIFPAEDRAIGVALKRARVDVKNNIHLLSMFLFCEVKSLLDCDHLSEFTAIGVGFGLSGSDAENKSEKLKLLAEVSSLQKGCKNSASKASDRQANAARFVEVDDLLMTPTEPQAYFFDECPSLSSLGKLMKKQFNDESKQIQLDFIENPKLSIQCSEAAYGLNYPNWKRNNDSQTARDHFLTAGFAMPDVSYYCPKECFNTTCASCDREKAYIDSYQDIADAVRSGVLKNVTEHYEFHGRHEGRVFSCFPRHQEYGVGTIEGCEAVFRRFIDSTRAVVSKWPVTGNERATSQNALVFCEGRLHEWTDYSLRVFRRYTGPHWLFYLIGPPNVTNVWRQEYSGPHIQIVTLPSEFGNLSSYPSDINRLFLSKFLWNETIQRENVLVVQSDSLLLRHGIEDFLEYDYVGSPVFPESFPDLNWRLLCAKHFHCGGNGGLSLRKRSAVLYALDRCSIAKDSIDEDQWYSGCIADARMNIPHPIIANRFSVGSKCDVDAPLGVHKLWQNCKESTCMEALVESQLFADIYGEDYQSNLPCTEGNAYYLYKNQDVARSFDKGFVHYAKYGRKEGRRWVCFDTINKPYKQLTPYDEVPSDWLQLADQSPT